MAGFNANLGRDIGEPSLGGAAPTRVVFSCGYGLGVYGQRRACLGWS